MNNPFSNPAFSITALTAVINILPSRYRHLEGLDLMPSKPVRQRQTVVKGMNGVLNLLPTLPPGSPGTVGVRGKHKLRPFVVPHAPHDDVMLSGEVQSIHAFGSETETETVVDVIARHLETMRNKHAITLEHLRMGALKGVIPNTDGSVLYDLFGAFGIIQQMVAFKLGTMDTNVKAKCTTVLATIEGNLKGGFVNGVCCLCSPKFFAALTGYAKVEKAFENWQNGAILIDDVRHGFTYGDITFEEYRGQATDVNETARRFTTAGKAHAFPLGTIDTFSTYFAPADFNGTVNTIGQPLYAKQEPRKFGRDTDLHTQSSPLPIYHRPGVLVKLTVA